MASAAISAFVDLQHLMEREIVCGNYDAVIHVAAVSDYAVSGTYSLPLDASFDVKSRQLGYHAFPLRMVDASAGKVKSNHSELWLRLTPTPKLVDLIRRPWGFRGVLVKFKLEVNVTETALKSIAEASRQHSQADFIVANTLDGMPSWALIGSERGFIKIPRDELASYLMQESVLSSPRVSQSSRAFVPC
jgi:phosphopantothenate-cysteine ligase/phosphopantothenoylcysteine decarboxylase/phosphopantothenate--cysteine ligase